jgi:hypothetical protein
MKLAVLINPKVRFATISKENSRPGAMTEKNRSWEYQYNTILKETIESAIGLAEQI